METNNSYYTLKDQSFGLSVRSTKHKERIERHSHEFIEFVFVSRGFAMHNADGDICLLVPGDILYILPGTAHQYWKSNNNTVYNCLFYPEVLGDDLAKLQGLPMLDNVLRTGYKKNPWGKIHLNANNRYEILSLIKKMEYETCKTPPGWDIRAKALLVDFLVSLSRIWFYNEKPDGHQHYCFMPTDAGIVSILESSFDKKTSIEAIAKAAGYSTDHYTRIFKKLTGLSPSTYLTSMRLAVAAEKLLDSEMSVSKAAEAVGFTDANYFSRLFKKETGKTPTQFKLSMHKGT
jgi:AraC family transcriptional regulator, L-rhamnose operon regulatory protein RhaS